MATPSVSSGQTGKSFIDLSQVASLINRRFYRQGLNWAVAGIKVVTAQPGPGQNLVGNVSIEKLPNTWVMSNAWEKGMRTWNKMNRMALEESGSVRPKFLDFKIYADRDHHDLGFGANLLPYSYTGVANAGEWVTSKFHIPESSIPSGNTVEREIIATGPNYPGLSTATGLDAVSLIEGYAASRGLPNIADPNAPDDAADAFGPSSQNWITAVFSDGTMQDDQVLEDMIEDNNIAPYPFENDGVNTDTMYPGGANQLSGMQIHDIASYGATTIGGTTRLKGGNFPCGLIKITHSVTSESTSHNVGLLIDLVPGNHRGYMCEPMTEM
jgi:hypothetical protein